MDSFEEKACLCALSRIFGFEPKKGLALIERMGCASAVFALDKDGLDELLGPYCRQRFQIRQAAVFEAADELENLAAKGIEFVGWGQEGYPMILTECPDPPIGLYIKSETRPKDLWTRPKNIAVIGTRDISPYGKEWCAKVVGGLAETQQKPLIVSGLALGTDICAHRTALERGLPTIAVMPTGPDAVYPHRHLAFADQLSHTPGCALITDYPPGTSPLPVNFLRRNRIIAGLSDATVLIESKIKGGGMMTARLAFSYNRDVFALPGRVDDLRSQGCNKMIAEKIAEPLVSVDEFLRSIGLDPASACAANRAGLPAILESHYGAAIGKDTAREMAALLECIRKNRGATVEELGAMTGIEYGRASSLTAMLELDGFISIDLLQRCCIISEKMH
jgi:DNA processing protein